MRNLAQRIVDALEYASHPDRASWGRKYPGAHEEFFTVYGDNMVETILPILTDKVAEASVKALAKEHGENMLVAASQYTKIMDSILEVHKAQGDDNCWMDIDKIFKAAGLPVPDRTVGDKKAMHDNCARFIETMCAGGEWKSYAALLRE